MLDTTSVVVCVGDVPRTAAMGGLFRLDLPEVLAHDATPDVVAEYLILQERAVEAAAALAAHRQDQRDVVRKVTHDLNNNIAVVRANVSFLQSTTTLGGDAVEALEEATDATRLMEQTLSDLQLMIALELNAEHVSRDRVAVVPLVMGAGEDWARRFASRNVRVDIDLPAQLCALGQASLLRRVFTNLLGARSRTLRNTTIEVRGRADGRMLTMTFADGGVGLLPDDRELALSRSGVDTQRARELGSTGVALYVARLIAQAHGGELTLVDLPPWSCCFQLVVPTAPYASISPVPEAH